MTGRLVHNTNSKIIDCSSFTNGVYFIKATTDSGIITKKLIKE
jgi:hypothetical protein